MRKLIAFALLLALLPSALADALSYSISLQYDTGKLSFKSIELVGVSSPTETADGEYKAKIVSFRGETLYATSFNVNLKRLYGLPVSRETAQRSITSNNISVNLLLPYYPTAQHIAISKEKEELLQIDVSKYSACNQNRICDITETSETCPEDCTCGNKVCEPAEDYMLCSADCEPGQKDSSGRKWYYALGALAIAAIIFIFLKRQNKKTNSGKRAKR